MSPHGTVRRRQAPGKVLEDVARRTAQVELTFDEAFMKRYAGFGHPSQLPIFILGMPRSGSTLIEQILSSHPQVHGAGELQAVHKSMVEMRWPYEGYLQPGADGTLMPSPPPKPANTISANWARPMSRRCGATAPRPSASPTRCPTTTSISG